MQCPKQRPMEVALKILHYLKANAEKNFKNNMDIYPLSFILMLTLVAMFKKSWSGVLVLSQTGMYIHGIETKVRHYTILVSNVPALHRTSTRRTDTARYRYWTYRHYMHQD